MDRVSELKFNVLVNLAYVLVAAGCQVFREAEHRMGLNRVKFTKQSKQAFNDLLKEAKRINVLEEAFDREIIKSMNGNYTAYQDWQRDVNDAARLLLLYTDRCNGDARNEKKVFDYIKGLQGADLFNDYDLSCFTLKETYRKNE